MMKQKSTCGPADIQTAQIRLTRDEFQRIQADLAVTEDFSEIAGRYSKFETVTHTAKFPAKDGSAGQMEMDVKLCCGDITDLSSNPLWMEAVLFENGWEVCHSEPSDALLPVWELEYEGTRYRTYLRLTDPKPEKPPYRLFLDLDNVLNVFRNDLHPRFQMVREVMVNPHYFRTLVPNTAMQAYVDSLGADQEHTYVLSHIEWKNAEYAMVNLHEKAAHLQYFYPSFSPDHILWVPMPLTKAEAVTKTFGRPLSKSDILVDDYNQNLFYWKKAGGTAVKYINYQNSPDSFNGPSIGYWMSSRQMKAVILDALQA